MAGLFKLTESILKNPIFAGLSDKEAEELASHCEVILLPPKRKVFSQGDEAKGMYILFRGMLEIRVEDLKGEEHSVGILEKGEIFGEMSVLDFGVRSASCYTTADVILLYIPGSSFRTMMKEGSPAIHRLLRFVLKRACFRLRALDDRLDTLFLEDKKKQEELGVQPTQENIDKKDESKKSDGEAE